MTIFPYVLCALGKLKTFTLENNNHCIFTYMHFDIHLEEDMKHIICLFVALKATEDRRTSKRKDSVTMYTAFSGMQVERGSYFNSIKTTFALISYFSVLFDD